MGNIAQLSWHQLLLQPILVLAFLTVNILTPLDLVWFGIQMLFGIISFKTFATRQWNDLVSVVSAGYLVFTENALVNILVLLPLDVIWVVIQFLWWVLEVIVIQWRFLLEGVHLLLRELYA